MKYEYHIAPMEYKSGEPAKVYQDQLSTLGEQGWELISVLPPMPIADGTRQSIFCFLKRPLKDSTKI